MSKFVRILFRSVLVLIVLAALTLAYIRYAAPRVHHGQIEAAISDAAGFDVSMPTPVELQLGETITLDANDIAINHPDWIEAEPLVKIGAAKIVVDTASLFSGPIEINLIEISGLTLRPQSADGRQANWTQQAAEAEPAASAEPVPPPLFHEIRITNFDVDMSHNETTVMQVSADLSSTISVRFEDGLPQITLDLKTPELRYASAASEPAEEPDEPAPVFSDEPLNLSFLRQLNLDADIAADSIIANDARLEDFVLQAGISDAALNLDTLQFGINEGTIRLSGTVVPAAAGHAVSLNAAVQQLKIAALAVEDQGAAEIPPLDASLAIAGTGASLHQIMASANGEIIGRHAPGQIDLQAAGPLFSDVVASVVTSLNPLAEARPSTRLDCGVYDIDIADGVANIEELAVQTERLTILSSGNVNLGTEAIDVSLSTKSREGLGLSIGSVANSFLKLSGTLNQPSVNLDAAGSVGTTGAAVATGGLSVLARGLFDRLSAEADICAPPEDSDG